MQPNDTNFTDTLSQAQSLSAVMADLETRSQRFGSALTGALRSAAIGGKGLEGVLQGLGNRLTDMALSAGLRPLENLVGNALNGLVGGLGGSFAGPVASPVANRVTPFADGGIVRSPSFFPADGGLGLMGEAGPEAILPLKRGSDGSLGVAAGGQAGGPQIVFNVTATDAGSFRKSEGQISAMLARSVGRGRRGL